MVSGSSRGSSSRVWLGDDMFTGFWGSAPRARGQHTLRSGSRGKAGAKQRKKDAVYSGM